MAVSGGFLTFKMHAPFARQEFGAVAGEASLTGPLHDVAVPGGTGAQEPLGGSDAGTTEVKAVGVPADPDGEVTGDLSVGVGLAGVGEQVEPPLIQREEPCLVKLAGQLGATGSVVGVNGLVVPTGVVKDGKELHDCEIGVGAVGQQPSVFKNASPVCKSMSPLQGLNVLGNDGLDERFGDHVGHL
jgi:hypothetical protein